MYAQILKSSILGEVNFGGDVQGLKERYKRAVKNVKKFNGDLIKAVKVKSANGEQTKFYNNDGMLLQEFYFLADKIGYEFGLVQYDRKGK